MRALDDIARLPRPCRTRTLQSVCVASLIAACATTAPPTRLHDTPAPREVAVFRGSDGTRARWNELVEAAARADAVLIGENHGHPLGLASAAALFEDVLARAPRASLSLEFFERDEQAPLDDYIAGTTSLAQFEQQAHRNAGNFPPGHRAMVEAAKRAGRPVHAANAPRAYVRRARIEGYGPLAALPPEETRLFEVPPWLAAGDYRERFDSVMSPSDAPRSTEMQQRLDDAFRSQQLWDWTMADSIARGVANFEQPVVQVIGRFHVDFHGGTVQALERRCVGVRVVTISFAPDASPLLRDEDLGRADFVIYVGAFVEAD